MIVKKKIGDLTIKEVTNICKGITDKKCIDDCPIYSLCIHMECDCDMIFEKSLDDEIEVDVE